MDIQARFKQGPLLFDGAMGTYFSTLTDDPTTQCELANLTQPQLISRIHREYLEAGCQAIKTNTFAANHTTLGEQTETVIRAGWTLACDAAKPYGALVFADIGPILTTEQKQPGDAYCQVADIFLDLGAQYFLFETMPDAKGLRQAAQHIHSRRADAFVITSFAVSPDGFTRQGLPGADLLAEMDAEPCVDAVGVNCISGPLHLGEYARSLTGLHKPLSVMPNAGYPTVIGSRTYFGNNAGYFAQQMVEIVRGGANIIGGCCGTTPEFLRRTHEALQAGTGAPAPAPKVESATSATPQGQNAFAQKLKEGKRVIAVELDPPRDADATAFLVGAKRLQQAGVDILTIADCPVARPRMDSSLLACKVRRELGMDTLPHMTCRDRNLNAIKALLLGLTMEQVHNVLIVTGDPIPSAQRDEVKSVFQFNSRMLARYISTINEELPTPFHICGALNLNAVNFQVQLRLAQEKVKNGVQTFLTQPVLSKNALENLKLAYETLDAKILAGIIPVVSHRNACFMNSEIPGISVCEEIVQLYEGKDREESAQLAVKISTAIAKEVAPYSHGLYLITPFQRVELIEAILQNLE